MMREEDMVAEIEALGEKLAQAKASITRRFIGQDRVVELTLTALLCGGHGLLVGLPGLGKTRLVETLSTVMGLDGSRVQFTPDLMPADILGSEVLDTAADGSRAFRFIEGPIFCQLLMADEINRASPRTQSALLQAMQERTVTVAGQDRPLGRPFHVLATQNPIEQEGTYPLPEAQLDRFMLNLWLDYPPFEDEVAVVRATTSAAVPDVKPVVTAEELHAFQQLVRNVPVSDHTIEHAVRLAVRTRPGRDGAPALVTDYLSYGAGPRASQYLVLAAKVVALLDGRLTPLPEDVNRVAVSVLRHRIVTNFTAEAEGVTPVDVIERLLAGQSVAA